MIVFSISTTAQTSVEKKSAETEWVDTEIWTSFLSSEPEPEMIESSESSAEKAPSDQPFPEIFSWSDIVSIFVEDDYTVGLRGDGTVVYAGKDQTWAHTIVEWTDIQRMEYLYYDNYIIGYKSDGTVRLVYTGWRSASWTEKDLADWSNIRSVLLDEPFDGDRTYIIGLKADGTVTAKTRDKSSNSTETDLVFGTDVSSWTDIKDLYFSSEYYEDQALIGLKNDGTIIATDYGWLSHTGSNISEWNNVEKLGFFYNIGIIGIKTDGTVIGKYGLGEGLRELDDSWTNIKEICAAGDFIYGLRNDGRVAIETWPEYYDDMESDDRMIQIRKWQDIVALIPSGCTPVGLCANGTVKVVTEADIGNGYGSFGAWDVSDWSGVKRIYGGEFCTIGLREDGSVLATGGEGDTASFVEELGTWKDIVEIYYDDFYDHVVGLKSDGTVVAVGDNTYGQCNLYP